MDLVGYNMGVCDCKFLNNIIIGNGYGMYFDSSPGNIIFGNIISGNIISSNNYNGIMIICHSNYEDLTEEEIIINNIPEYYITPIDTVISRNIISNNSDGIFVDDYSCGNNICGNLISNNSFCGVFIGYSWADLHFNSITSNRYGLYVDSGSYRIVNATNNWWGTNNISYLNSTSQLFLVISGIRMVL